MLSEHSHTITTRTITDTIYSTKIDTITLTEIKPYKVNHYDTTYLYHNVDTAKILHDYFAANYYQDTVINDSSLTISYNAKVYKNKLDSISFRFKNNRPTIINKTTTVINTPPKIYFSALIGGNSQYFDYGVGVSYQRDKYLFSGNYLINSKSVYVGVGFGF